MLASDLQPVAGLVVIDASKGNVGVAVAVKAEWLRRAFAKLEPEERQTLISAIALVRRMGHAASGPPSPKEEPSS